MKFQSLDLFKKKKQKKEKPDDDNGLMI